MKPLPSVPTSQHETSRSCRTGIHRQAMARSDHPLNTRSSRVSMSAEDSLVWPQGASWLYRSDARLPKRLLPQVNLPFRGSSLKAYLFDSFAASVITLAEVYTGSARAGQADRLQDLLRELRVESRDLPASAASTASAGSTG
jgi:hypothetical protein